MTDTETLLRKAAMAAGYKPVRMSDDGRGLLLEGVQEPWNSADNSGDALDLAIRTRQMVNIARTHAEVTWYDERDDIAGSLMEWAADDIHAATRLAITRAAAAIYDSQQGAAA